jgi:hypothetical protein
MEVAVDPKQLEAEFFAKTFEFSYSGLNRLLYSPKLFYTYYILGQREERLDAHLIEGKVIHCLLLNNGSFDEQFLISPGNLPGDNARMIIDRIYNQVKEGPGLLENYSVEILEILKEINLHQKLKTNEQRLEKILTEQNVSYFEFLKTKGNKDLIDTETLERCTKGAEELRNNTKVRELLALDILATDDFGIYNEIALNSPQESTEFPFGFKGILDNLTVDLKNKIVRINDLKTTSKTLGDFKESVEYYHYWLQAAIYIMLARWFLKDVIKSKDWKFIFHFIVLDKYNQVYPFEVQYTTMMEWDAKFALAVHQAKWHFESREFSLPYEFATGTIKL